MCLQCYNACSHAQGALHEKAEVHAYGIELYYYRNLLRLYGNASEYPSAVAYNALDYKYGLINISATKPFGEYSYNGTNNVTMYSDIVYTCRYATLHF